MSEERRVIRMLREYLAALEESVDESEAEWIDACKQIDGILSDLEAAL